MHCSKSVPYSPAGLFPKTTKAVRTLITPRATRGGQPPKGIIFPGDSGTLGQLSIWPRGGLLVEECLTFGFFWPWVISPLWPKGSCKPRRQSTWDWHGQATVPKPQTPDGVAMWQRHSHAKRNVLRQKELEGVEYFANPLRKLAKWQR